MKKLSRRRQVARVDQNDYTTVITVKADDDDDDNDDDVSYKLTMFKC